MKPGLFLTALASVLVATSFAASDAVAKEKKPKLVRYKKDSGIGLGAFGGKLLHSYGYKDKQLENGNTLVTGAAKSKNGTHSQYIAIYRAAELALEQEQPVIQVMSVNGKQLNAVFAGATGSGAAFNGPAINYGTRYVMEVTFSDAPSEEGHCSESVLRAECKSIDAAAAMREIRPFLKIKTEKKKK